MLNKLFKTTYSVVSICKGKDNSLFVFNFINKTFHFNWTITYILIYQLNVNYLIKRYR